MLCQVGGLSRLFCRQFFWTEIDDGGVDDDHDHYDHARCGGGSQRRSRSAILGTGSSCAKVELVQMIVVMLVVNMRMIKIIMMIRMVIVMKRMRALMFLDKGGAGANEDV